MDGAAASRVPRMANWKIKCDAVKRLLTATPAFWNTILFTRTMATEHTVLSKMRRRLRERMANGEWQDDVRGLRPDKRMT